MKLVLDGKEISAENAEALRRIILTDRDVIALKIDGNLKDIYAQLTDGMTAETVTVKSPEGLDILWHTSAHIMAQALMHLYPGVKLTIGPSIENGFYYDIDMEHKITEEEFGQIEEEFRNIVSQKIQLTREEIKRTEAIEIYRKENNEYKVEILSEIADDTVTIYRQGDFFDLCRGPHLPDTSFPKSFKVMSVAGAYWRGSEKNKMLQRVYGISFPSKKEMDDYLAFYREALERDHRKIGKELDLFTISPEVGPGLIIWKPRAAYTKMRIEDLWKKEHLENGYELLSTPHVARSHLWTISGHFDFYRDNLYPEMEFPEGDKYLVKPMNCPFHILVFKEKLRSYRELPIRYAELGTVYRYEKSGVLHGLLRVRGFTQDDAHIFCVRDDLETEVKKLLDFNLFFLKKFGFSDFKVYLATMPEKAVGTKEEWDRAEAALTAAVKSYGMDFTIDRGGGAFYGPKIDVKIKDALKREWQTTTIQFDFNEPERFDLSYINEKGDKERPIMIHRALLGSIERFFGVLLEHYKGDLPLWLSYKEAVVLPVSDNTSDYAQKVCGELLKKGIRAYVDGRNERLGYKVRDARLQKIPYFIVVGENEEKAGLIKPNGRKEGEMAAMTMDAFLDVINRRRAGE